MAPKIFFILLSFFLLAPSQAEEKPIAAAADYLEATGILEAKDANRDHEALLLLQKSSSNGYTLSDRVLAEIHFFGHREIPKDSILARQHATRAALAGDAWSANLLGFIHEKGIGTEPSRSDARQWYEYAALRGDPKAPLSLGLLYRSGPAAEQDTILSYAWLSIAKQAGEVGALRALEGFAHSLNPTQLQRADKLITEIREKMKKP